MGICLVPLLPLCPELALCRGAECGNRWHCWDGLEPLPAVPGPEGHRSAGAAWGWAPGAHGRISPGLVAQLQIHKLGKSCAKRLHQDFAFLVKFLLQQEFMFTPESLILFPYSGERGCQHQWACLETSVCEKPEQQSSRELPGGAGSRRGAAGQSHSSGPCG